MTTDFKKTQKELYLPRTAPSIIDVPAMKFLAVDGAGDPNTSPDYASAIELLYGLSYSIKMNNKARAEYVVAPLEGFWESSDDFRGGGAPLPDKNKLVWTAVIRQPDFVTDEIVAEAKKALAIKKPNLDVSRAKLITFVEGLCVQALHIGSYDSEPATVSAIEKFAHDEGYALDMSSVRRHHEIYLSDPRRVAPEKLKTVIRHPVKKCK